MKMLRKLFQRFTERHLALWSSGMLGFIGLGKETTWGTGVSATDYFEIMSENIGASIARYPTRNAYGGFHEPDDMAGAVMVAGDMSVAAFPVPLGVLLKAIMNTSSIGVVASGVLWKTNFITTKSEFADGVPSQPYTIEVHRDTGSSFRYAGGQANQLQMTLAPNQDLRCTVGWLAKQPSIIARSTPTFVSSPDPFAWDTASVSVGGSATSRLEAFNLSVRNNINPHLALANSVYAARMRRGDAQLVRFGGTYDFQDQAEYDDFIAQTERAFVLNLTRANSMVLNITMPRVVYETFPPAIGGRDRLTVGFTGIAKYHAGSGCAINFALTSTKSNY
jgi:hypothetical protein